MVAQLAPAHLPRLTEFRNEYQAAVAATREITGERDLMAHRPLLAESLRLRSPLIHPLNVLQVVAIQRQEADLLRVTTTGIASGMLTTG
jgi:phosphoenolpyruvate carboxylase